MDEKEKAQSIKESFHSIYEKHFSNLTSDLKEKLYYELEQMYSNHSEEERKKVFSFIECKLNIDQRKQLLSEFYLNHAESTPSQIISFFQDTENILNKICQQQNISEADLMSKGFSNECSLPEDPPFFCRVTLKKL
jgi:hypothetical protein